MRPLMIVLWIGASLMLAALSLTLSTGWLPASEQDQAGVWAIMAGLFILMAALGAYLALLRIDWDADGLRIRMPGLGGLSHRRHGWSDLMRVTLKPGHWRIDCRDGGHFRIGVGNMAGGEALLREIARRRIPADHDILEAIDAERST